MVQFCDVKQFFTDLTIHDPFFFALLEDYITTYAILFLKGNVITFRTKNKKQKN